VNTRVAQEKTPMSGVSINFSRLLKPLVFVACLIPFGMAVLGVASNKFVDPVESLLLMRFSNGRVLPNSGVCLAYSFFSIPRYICWCG